MRPAARILDNHKIRGYCQRMVESVFEIIGPAMVGPSSSHTAGAIRIGLAARALLGDAPVEAHIGLHGSFAATGVGHATDRGLVAGLLGYATDDERMVNALEHASASGCAVTFETVHLGDQAHPNTAQLELRAANHTTRRVTASSIGGGSIEIVQVDGFPTSFTGTLDTLLLWHGDVPGFLSKVTTIVACVEINIASIRTARSHRGARALTVVEMDAPLPEHALALLRSLKSVDELKMVNRIA